MLYSISLCFLSCASLFSLSSCYDILRVPINLGPRVSAFFCEIYLLKIIQFEWKKKFAYKFEFLRSRYGT
jgi:hypothetical protein